MAEWGEPTEAQVLVLALARNYSKRSEWGKLSFDNNTFYAARLWHDAVLGGRRAALVATE